MKAIIRKMNLLFISVILTVFYVTVIGVTSIIMKTFFAVIPKKKQRSYWQDFKKQTLSRKYFESEY